MATLELSAQADQSDLGDDDWTPNASDQAAIDAGCWYDDEAAARVCDFFEKILRHSRGRHAGRPFLLERWQRRWLSDLFGWKRADGTRRFREAYLEVPKKNGKSAMLSGICLYMLLEEVGAEVYTGAVDRQQAAIIFDEAARMVRASPALSARLVIVDSKKLITFPARNAKLSAMSADAPSKDGVSASCTVLDEVHRYKNSSLYDVMKYAGAAREQPLMISITTAGHDRHSLCWGLHEKARGILAGDLIDPEFHATIFAAEEGDDLDDPAVWARANPSMGSVIKLDDFAREHREARLLPRLWALFRRLRLNIWTESESRWLPLDRWDALVRPLLPEDLAGRPCYAALDLSSTTDLTAMVLAFPLDDGTIHLHPIFWMPSETAPRRSEADKVAYPQWIAAGHMVETEGVATDYDAIRASLNEVAARFDLVKVALDPWNARQLAHQLADDGLTVQLFAQNYASMSPAAKELERLLLLGRLSHDGSPVLRWCAGNTVVVSDAAGNIKPDKSKSSERIDGLVAAVMAVGLAAHDVPEAEPGITVVDFPGFR